MTGAAASRGGASRERCLVTGATGFIGSHLAARLVEEGYRVRCLRRETSDTTRLADLDVELVAGDLTRPASLADAVAGCDHVLHCGALVSDWAGKGEIRLVNVAGTRSLGDAAAAASVRRLVYFSTTDVYGHPGGREVDESQPGGRFANWYAATKREAEAELSHVARASSLELVVLRPATVYGPGSTDVIGEIALAIRARKMILIDRGRAIAGLCYVDNLIDAAVLALRHDRAAGAAFNVSDGLNVTWRRFADDLADGLECQRVRWSMPYWAAHAIGYTLEHAYRALHAATGLTTPPLLSRQAVQVLGIDQDFSSRAAREVLGWSPRVGYSAGLRQTLAWLIAGEPAAG